MSTQLAHSNTSGILYVLSTDESLISQEVTVKISELVNEHQKSTEQIENIVGKFSR